MRNRIDGNKSVVYVARFPYSEYEHFENGSVTKTTFVAITQDSNPDISLSINQNKKLGKVKVISIKDQKFIPEDETYDSLYYQKTGEVVLKANKPFKVWVRVKVKNGVLKTQFTWDTLVKAKPVRSGKGMEQEVKSRQTMSRHFRPGLF